MGNLLPTHKIFIERPDILIKLQACTFLLKKSGVYFFQMFPNLKKRRTYTIQKRIKNKAEYQLETFLTIFNIKRR